MKKTILGILVMCVFMTTLGFAIAAPFGATSITEESSSAAASGAAQTHDALAGNVTELTISGTSNTQSWQGYFGNVSGAIQLADGSSNVMYNWSLASPQGEIYASTDASVSWGSIACFNYTADGATTETAFNIAEGNVDGLNETFTGTSSINVGSTSLTSCDSTEIYDETGASNVDFVEVLLWDGDAIVFASLLEEDVLGFDNNLHDFEMMVLEDGHNGNAGTTTYNFYVELE